MDTEEKPRIIEGNLFVDDRGCLSFVNDFDFKGIKRFYVIENHQQGFIRAFHYHKNESKYVFVISGSILIYIVNVKKNNLRNSEVKKFVLSSKKPQILFIPKGYANGFKTLEKDTKIIFYSTSILEESLIDDIRYPFDQWGNWNNDYR
ncbi:dTDP-4-dehydrorhamnose 3,5-epimerase family protein [Candidatus Pacearchaeota archaeon]|nr:dTDP-4-dehydrorhamnose 3,5-epimerase family protein [Candidatus Pacearchaeota archaeon]